MTLPPMSEWGASWNWGKLLPSLEWLRRWQARPGEMRQAQTNSNMEESARLEESRKQSELSAFAESQPSGLYNQAISGLPQEQQGFFSPRYNDIYNKYLAQLTRSAQEGAEPTGTFGSFLKNYDFYKEYMSQPYLQRGGYQARSLAPRTRTFNF